MLSRVNLTSPKLSSPHYWGKMLFYDIYLVSAASSNGWIFSLLDVQTDPNLTMLLPGANCDVTSIKACLFRSQFSLSASCQGKLRSCFWLRRNPTQLRVYHILKTRFPSALLCLFCLLYLCCTGHVAEIWLEI